MKKILYKVLITVLAFVYIFFLILTYFKFIEIESYIKEIKTYERKKMYI